MTLRPKVFFAVVLSCSVATGMPRQAASQHITIDGRFSSTQTLVGSNYSISTGLGKQVGSNFFHSFGQFGLATGESATFSGPATISNVIGRVTGGSPSSIDGKIQSNITGANLYLTNPNGIVFGPNATVNVARPITINANSVVVDGTGNPNSVTILGSVTRGPARRATAADVSVSAGNVTILANGEIGSFTYGPGNAGGVSLDVQGVLSIDGTSAFLTGIFSRADVGSTGAAGTVIVNAGSLSITNDGLISVASFGSGNVGSALVRAGSLSIASGGVISGSTYASGNAGNLSLSVSGDLSIDGAAGSSEPGIFSRAEAGSTGAAGTIMVSAGSLSILNTGTISTSTFGSGGGGSISVTAGTLLMAGYGLIASNTSGTGNAGQVTIAAGTLSITSSSEIESFSSGPGRAATSPSRSMVS